MSDTLTAKAKVSSRQLILLSIIGFFVLAICCLGIIWQKTTHKTQMLETKIVALQRQITALPTPETLPFNALTNLDAKIVQLRTDIDALNTPAIKTAPLPLAPQASSPVMAIFAVQFLRDQVNKGTSFIAPYQNVMTALRDMGISLKTPTLEEASKTGIPTNMTLATQFDTIIRTPVKLVDSPSSWLGKTLSSLVQVKKVYAQDSNQKDAATQAKQALQRDDVQRALSEIDHLPQELRRQQQLRDWEEDVKKRQAVLQELDALEKQAVDITKKRRADEKQPALTPAP